MTKYLIFLTALFALVACENDINKIPLISDESAVTDNEPYDEQPDETVDLEQPDIDTTPVWVTYAGLEWSPLSENTMNWQSAMDYCEAMDARLPNINELRKVIINCPGSTYGGACQVSDPDCLSSDCRKAKDCECDGYADSYSALGDGDIWLWSSSSLASYTDYAWFVYFDGGYVHGNDKNYSYHARCVR